MTSCRLPARNVHNRQTLSLRFDRNGDRESYHQILYLDNVLSVSGVMNSFGGQTGDVGRKIEHQA